MSATPLASSGSGELWPRRAVWALLAAVVAALLFIVLRYSWQAVERYQAAQIAIGTAAGAAAANQLAEKMGALVQSVDLFARTHADSLDVLARGRGGPALERRLQDRLAVELPRAQRFFLTAAGADSVDHLAQLRADVADFQSYRRGRETREVIWHGDPGDVHFDVLVELDDPVERHLVVSFGIDALQGILSEAQPRGHHLLVARRDLDGEAQIILTERGVPEGSDRALTPAMLERAAGGSDVLGSRWRVVDLLEPDLVADYRNRQLSSAAVLITAVLLALGLIALLLSRQVRRLEHRQEALASENVHLHYQSLHDPLTGLPNRVLLDERLGQRVAEAGRSGRRFALMVLDLDSFKQINTTFGRSLGDRILSEMAERIRALLRDNDTVARVGDDDFAVLVDVDDRGQAELIAAKVLDSLGRPCELASYPISLSANLGIALFPDHGREAPELLKHAEIAMLRARGSGTRTSIFQPADDPERPDRLSLLAGLRDAIRDDQLFLEFQPKLDCHGGDRPQAEALLRWQHPVHGRLGPDAYLPLVEQTDTIEQLTHWVVEETLRTLRATGEEFDRACLAVNLSARMLHRDAFPLWVDRKLQEYGVGAQQLCFEVTESAIMSDSDKALEVLINLASIGCSISVDDFGVGYSSLAYLSRLPASEMKIDRSFVAGMMHYEGDRSIVRAIIDLAHDLSLVVVAEGVEREAQIRALRDYGCDLLQGYGISPPLSAEDLRRWWSAPPPLP